MSVEHEGIDEGVERRKESIDVGKKLARIETLLEGLKEQVSARFESVKNWQLDRDMECRKLEEDIVKLRIEQATQGTKVQAWSLIGATIMSAAVAVAVHYLTRK